MGPLTYLLKLSSTALSAVATESRPSASTPGIVFTLVNALQNMVFKSLQVIRFKCIYELKPSYSKGYITTLRSLTLTPLPF